MRKVIICFLFLWGALSANAQSTCERRVDAHQEATTNQRVNYCLTADSESEQVAGPQLIFSAVDSYTVPQPAETSSVPPTAKKGAFKEDQIEITHSFVQTRQFPKWRDGRVSEQYKQEYREALSSGSETAQEAVSQTECEPEEPDTEEAGVGKESGEEKETEAGLRARQKKSGRRWVKQNAAEQVVEAPAKNIEKDTAATDTDFYDSDAYAPATSGEDPAGYMPEGIAGMPAEETQDLAAEAYSYTSTEGGSSSAPEATNGAEIPNEEGFLKAGEYSYAPADYGIPASATETENSREAPQGSEGLESIEIPVGEYSYAPAE